MTNFKLQKLVYLLEYQITRVTIVDKKQESLFSCKKKKKKLLFKVQNFWSDGKESPPQIQKRKENKNASGIRT